MLCVCVSVLCDSEDARIPLLLGGVHHPILFPLESEIVKTSCHKMLKGKNGTRVRGERRERENREKRGKGSERFANCLCSVVVVVKPMLGTLFHMRRLHYLMLL